MQGKFDLFFYLKENIAPFISLIPSEKVIKLTSTLGMENTKETVCVTLSARSNPTLFGFEQETCYKIWKSLLHVNHSLWCCTNQSACISLAWTDRSSCFVDISLL